MNNKYNLSISKAELKNIILLHEECRRIYYAMQRSMKQMTGAKDQEVSYHFPTLGPDREMADPTLLKNAIIANSSAYSIMLQCTQYLQEHLNPIISYALEHDFHEYESYTSDLYTVGIKAVRIAAENYKYTKLEIDDYFYQTIVACMRSEATKLAKTA